MNIMVFSYCVFAHRVANLNEEVALNVIIFCNEETMKTKKSKLSYVLLDIWIIYEVSWIKRV